MNFHRSTESIYHMFKRVNASCNFKGIEQHERPVVDFIGTVKLHGTNAGIRMPGVGIRPIALSRTRKLTVNNDNHGFAMFLEGIPQEIFDELYMNNNGENQTGAITLFGEWCGGSVQSKVALKDCPKHFVAFAATRDDFSVEEGYRYIDWDYADFTKEINSHRLFSVRQIPEFEITIDFRNGSHEDVVAQLTTWVEEVEAMCPWAKQIWNVEGIGEGIVFHRKDDPENNYWIFKVKGDKHSGGGDRSKGKLVEIDLVKVENVSECVDVILTEARMIQMVNDNNFDFDPRNIGPFLKAVCVDCVKEQIDVVIENGLEWDDVSKVVQTRARNWFLAKSKEV